MSDDAKWQTDGRHQRPMSDEAKQYTGDEVDDSPRAGETVLVDHVRFAATVRALDAAKARIAELEAERTTVAEMERIAAQAVAADQRRIAELEEEARDTKDWNAHLQAESEALAKSSNEWMRSILGPAYGAHWGPTLEAFGRGVDELRAARVLAEHERDEWKARAARLREALVKAREYTRRIYSHFRDEEVIEAADRNTGSQLSDYGLALRVMDSALAETPVEPLRERLMRVAEEAFHEGFNDAHPEYEGTVKTPAAIVDAEMKR